MSMRGLCEFEDEPKSRVLSERDFVSILIALYRDKPILWQTTSKDYFNKFKKNAAVVEIVGVLKRYKPDFTEELFKKKINTLRTNFNREYQKLQRQKRLGAPAGDIDEPSLWYYEDLLFVKDQVQTKEAETSEESLTEDGNASYSNCNRLNPPKRLKKTSSDMTKEFVGLATNYLKKTENEMDLVLKIWTIKLSRISSDQQRIAVKMINDILYEAERGRLADPAPSTILPNSTSVSMVFKTPQSPALFSSANNSQNVPRSPAFISLANNNSFKVIGTRNNVSYTTSRDSTSANKTRHSPVLNESNNMVYEVPIINDNVPCTSPPYSELASEIPHSSPLLPFSNKPFKLVKIKENMPITYLSSQTKADIKPPSSPLLSFNKLCKAIDHLSPEDINTSLESHTLSSGGTSEPKT